MNISLTPELERLVRKKVASGDYIDASEVIREALRAMLEGERENDWLKREAAIGFAQLEAGEMVEISSKEDFMELIREADKAI